MATLIYTLCSAASFFCAVLLWRQYKNFQLRLLLLSSIAFLFFAANNALLLVDMTILKDGPDLSLVRSVASVLGATVLLFGLIKEMR